MTKIPSDDILEGLYKLRIRESEKLKKVLELYNMEIHHKKAGPDYHRSFCEKWHRQVDEQPSKRSKKNGDKSAVAMLKKHEQHDRTLQPVVCRDTRHAQGLGPVAVHEIHDNWVAYSRKWSRRSLHRFYGRAQTYGNQFDV